MARPSLKAQRLEHLRRICSEGAIVRLADAAARLGTTEITIRRDLQDKATGLACLGGYVMQIAPGADGYSLAQAEERESAAKIAAATAAISVIQPGDTIFVDCGTTTPHLVARLPYGMRLTVVTNALNCAEILARNDDCDVVLLGGFFYRSTASFVSESAVEQISRLKISKAFLSAGGVTRDLVTCFHSHEVPIKRAAIARAAQSFLVADTTKWGHRAAATFARLDEFSDWFGAPREVTLPG